MLTVYIHGAFTSNTCFDYMRAKLQTSDELLVSYDAEDGLENNVNRIKQEIEGVANSFPVNVIGHSMGGLIGALLYHKGLPINRLITISAPMGGSKAAEKMSWLFPFNTVLKDLSDKKIYGMLERSTLDIPHLFIVTEKGNIPFLFQEKNDGVISVASQTSIKSANYKMFPYNHHEVLCADDVCHEISLFVDGSIINLNSTEG